MRRIKPMRTMARKLKAGASMIRRPLSERRKFGRIKGGQLRCNRGTVIDISSGGMKLRSRTRIQGKMKIKLWTHLRDATVPAQVVWTERLGFRKYDIGLQFYDVTDEIADTLSAFAMYLRS